MKLCWHEFRFRPWVWIFSSSTKTQNRAKKEKKDLKCWTGGSVFCRCWCWRQHMLNILWRQRRKHKAFFVHETYPKPYIDHVIVCGCTAATREPQVKHRFRWGLISCSVKLEWVLFVSSCSTVCMHGHLLPLQDQRRLYVFSLLETYSLLRKQVALHFKFTELSSTKETLASHEMLTLSPAGTFCWPYLDYNTSLCVF